MLNFFAIVIIIFIGVILIIFKKRKFLNLLNIKNLYPKKSKINKEINSKYPSKKKTFSYKHDEKKYSEFYKNAQRNKMWKLFKEDKEAKLEALKIAEELSDKSTLSILRRGLKDISPEVVEKSARLIKNFK